MKKFQYWNEGENDCAYFSSKAQTIEEALETFQCETGGPCMGPEDFTDDDDHQANRAWAIDLLEENFRWAEEISEAEAQERIDHLADEWEITPDDLAYLM